MVITFYEKRRRLRYLFPVLGIVILITLIIIWRGFFVKEKEILPEKVIERQVKKIEINYEILKTPLLEELQPLEKIESFEKEIGRDNPFIPY